MRIKEKVIVDETHPGKSRKGCKRKEIQEDGTGLDILTPIRSNNSNYETNMYSTPQTYQSGVIYSGVGAYDWGISGKTTAYNLMAFEDLNKRRSIHLHSSIGSKSEYNTSPLSTFPSASTTSSESSSAELDICREYLRKKSKKHGCFRGSSIFASPRSLFSASLSPPSFELSNFSLQSNPSTDTISPVKDISPFYDILSEY